MRILYAVQATGNGHIARAIELMPFLQKMGKVDVFLSGSNSHLPAALPVVFKSKGLSLFYGNKGGLNYPKMLQSFSPFKIMKEASALPVEKYDLVINDFECITSLACKIKRVNSIGLGHQASFKSRYTPRPEKKDLLGEFILNNYATASDYIGLHFENYDSFIHAPVIKEQVLKANPQNNGHITVYLSHYSDEVLQRYFSKLTSVQFQVFSKKIKQPVEEANIKWMPISNEGFTKSMIDSVGVITGAGFETPAEAMYLQKKLLCLPIKGQYEQLCNAAALQKLGVKILNAISEDFSEMIESWLNQEQQNSFVLQNNTAGLIEKIMEKVDSPFFRPSNLYNELLQEDSTASNVKGLSLPQLSLKY
ncbi:glycosyltransferase family protein [Sediminibacterium sp.]|uniref:glycosyltransferase family protein n=1 Tax=Sediminibacterium sp. TaxID=1917865 RepID=UPI003F6A0AF3